MQKHKPYCKNVDGGFYVEDGCCTLCSVPWIVAPGFFTLDNEGRHCFVSKQPSQERLDRVLQPTESTLLALRSSFSIQPFKVHISFAVKRIRVGACVSTTEA